MGFFSLLDSLDDYWFLPSFFICLLKEHPNSPLWNWILVQVIASRSSKIKVDMSQVYSYLWHQKAWGVWGPQHIDKEVICQHIQLLNLLTLYEKITNHNKSHLLSDLDICVPRGPEQVGDASPAHCSGYGFAGRLDTGEQLGEVTWYQMNTIKR